MHNLTKFKVTSAIEDIFNGKPERRMIHGYQKNRSNQSNRVTTGAITTATAIKVQTMPKRTTTKGNARLRTIH
jgi:hypothetical protein